MLAVILLLVIGTVKLIGGGSGRSTVPSHPTGSHPV